MPRVGWLVKGEKVPHEEALAQAKRDGHYHNFPPAVWEALYRSTERVDKLWLPPSSAAGCPRQHFLKMTEDYWLDPEAQWMSLCGSGYHSLFEGEGADHREMYLSLPLSVRVVVDGQRVDVRFPLQGTLDHYDAEYRRITDYKCTGKFGYRQDGKWVNKEFPQPQHVTQINLYRLLLECAGYPVESAQIFYFRPESKAPRKVVPVDLWTLEEAEMEATLLAEPLVLTALTGRLPECRCSFPGYGMDRDICKETDDDDWFDHNGEWIKQQGATLRERD